MAGKKKNYIEVVESDWTNGIGAKDLFIILNAMDEGQIQARIDEIGKAIEETEKESSKLARKARRSQRAGASKDEMAANQQEIDNLTDIQIQLEDERDMLELFPKVKSVMSAIDEVKTDMIAREASQSMQIGEAEEELKALEEQEEEAKAQRDRAKEIDEEIEQKEGEITALNGKRPRVMAAIQGEIEDLIKEKSGLISHEDYTKVRTALITKKSEVGKMKAQKRKDDEALALCQDPWNKVLKGYEWEDIAELSDADLSSVLGVKVSMKDEKPKDKDKKDDKDKDKGKDKGDEGRGGRQGGFGGGPIPPEPETPPAPEPEQEEPEPEEEAGDEEEIKGWFARKLEEWKDSRQAKKEAKEAFIEEFRLTRGRKPNWFERFKARHPKMFKEKVPVISKKTPEELKEEAIAAKARTPEEIEAARALIEKNKTARIQTQGILDRIEAERPEQERKANEIKIQLSGMSSQEILEMRPLYADVLSEDRFNTMYASAVMREVQEAKKAKEAKKAGKKETEKEAKTPEASASASSSRAAHRAFAKDLGGVAGTPAQQAPETNTPQAPVAEKSAPSTPTVAHSVTQSTAGAGHGER